MQENRSFDHYFGRMTHYGHAVDGFDASFTNPTGSGGTASPRHAPTTCIGPDIPHAWTRMHDQYDHGALDGFFTNAATTGDGHRALYWFDERDVPFYYWVYSHFAMADRHFSSVLGPTWPNRDYLYAAQSDGVHNTDERIIHVRTIFDALHDAHVTFREYATGDVRSHCAGRTMSSPGVVPLSQIWTDLADGTLPRVSFIDVSGAADEHSVADVQDGEAFFRRLVLALFASPEWESSALFYTYDESGGFFDHVPPPHACVPDGRAANADFTRMGFRVPLLVVSPWARRGYVSHVVHEATSVTRFVELLFDLPALTDRDANSDALLDMFDFTTPELMTPPSHPPAAGTGGCPP
jgi:phospholipase C